MLFVNEKQTRKQFVDAMSVSFPFQSLGSKTKLERDRAVLSFKTYVASLQCNTSTAAATAAASTIGDSSEIRAILLKGLQRNDEHWELNHGNLCAIGEALDSSLTSVCNDEQFLVALCERCLQLLTHSEARVRLACADVLKRLAQRADFGIRVYQYLKNDLFALIERDFERRHSFVEPTSTTTASTTIDGATFPIFTAKPTAFSPNLSWMLPNAMHEAEGWGVLESSLVALLRIVDGCGAAFAPFVADVVPLLRRAVAHTNRFAREHAYSTIACLARCASPSTFDAELLPSLVPSVANGMLDGWSEVRYTANVACRAILQSPSSATISDDLSSSNRRRSILIDWFLPPLCVARFDVADGVKLYAQQTWRDVLGSNARNGNEP